MNGKPKSEPKIDEEVEETFPASDPPSYINTASEEELGALPALGPDLVRALVEARPFQSWEDLKELAGFEGKTIAALKHGGAYIGWESAGPN